MSVRKMAAVGKIHSKYLVAMFESRHQNSHICLCAGVRLNVCVFGTEHLFCPVDRGLLNNISELTAAVITLSRISLRILVRKNRAHRLEYSFGHKIFRRDQLKAVRLTRDLVVNRLAYQRIDFGNIRCKKTVSFHMSMFSNSSSVNTLTPRPSALVNLDPAS